MNTPYIIDNNLFKDIRSLPSIAKTFYQDPNAQLLFFGEQFTEMMGFGIKGAQLTLQNTYKGEAAGFYKELQAQFNQLLNRAYTQYFYIPKALKVACKKLMQGITQENQEEFYAEFSNIAKSCIIKTKEKHEATHTAFLAYYKGAARTAGNDAEQMEGEIKAEKNLTTAVKTLEDEILMMSRAGVKAIDIEEAVYRKIKGILNIGKNPKIIKSFSKSLVSKFSAEVFLNDFSDNLNNNVIPYQVALLGANFSKNIHARLYLSDKEENTIELFLKETDLHPTEIEALYLAKLDINDMMIIRHTQKKGGIFVSRNEKIFSQIRKNPKLEKMLLPVHHQILKQTTIAPSSHSVLNTTMAQDSSFTPVENQAVGGTTTLQNNDLALTGKSNILSFTKHQEVFTGTANSKKMDALTEHQKNLLEKCLYILTVSDNNIPLNQTRKRFLPSLLQAVESLEEIYALLDKMHEMELGHLLTTETIKRFSEKREVLQNFISIIDFLENKGLATETAIQNLIDTMEFSSDIQTGIHLLDENNILTRENYKHLISAKKDALIVAESFLMLLKKAPSLLNADTIHTLVRSKVHAKTMAGFIIQLYEKDETLSANKHILNIPCEKIISNMEGIIENIFFLFEKNKEILNHEKYFEAITVQRSYYTIEGLWDFFEKRNELQSFEGCLTEGYTRSLYTRDQGLEHFQKILDYLSKENEHLINHPATDYLYKNPLKATEVYLQIKQLDEAGVMNEEKYIFFVYSAMYSKKVAIHIALLGKKNAALFHEIIAHTLHRAGKNIEKMSEFILRLYEKNVQLALNENILNISVEKILSNMDEILKAIFFLHEKNANLLNNKECLKAIQIEGLNIYDLLKDIYYICEKIKSIKTFERSLTVQNIINLHKIIDEIKVFRKILEHLVENNKEDFLTHRCTSYLFLHMHYALGIYESIKTLEEKGFLDTRGYVYIIYSVIPPTSNTLYQWMSKDDEIPEEAVKTLMRETWVLLNGHPELVTDEGLDLLGDSGENVLPVAKGLITLKQASPTLLIRQNKIVLFEARHNAQLAAEALIIFYTKNKKLLEHEYFCTILIHAENRVKAVALNLVNLYQHDKKLLTKDMQISLLAFTPAEIQSTTFALCMLLQAPELLKDSSICQNIIQAKVNALYLAKALLLLYKEDPTLINASLCTVLQYSQHNAPSHAEIMVMCVQKGISISESIERLLQGKESNISDTLNNMLLAHSEKEEEKSRFTL